MATKRYKRDLKAMEARHADAQARCSTSRHCARTGSEPTDGLDVGQASCRRSASVAPPSIRQAESTDGNRQGYLPAYAPEFNPVEYVRGYLKTREVANLCATNIHEVSDFARRRLKSMQRRPKLVTAFWKQAELSI